MKERHEESEGTREREKDRTNRGNEKYNHKPNDE